MTYRIFAYALHKYVYFTYKQRRLSSQPPLPLNQLSPRLKMHVAFTVTHTSSEVVPGGSGLESRTICVSEASPSPDLTTTAHGSHAWMQLSPSSRVIRHMARGKPEKSLAWKPDCSILES